MALNIPLDEASSAEADHAGGTPAHGKGASSELIAHIQATTEQQKALLARELHDELGGLLVGAVMDLAWAEQHLAAPTADLKAKLLRARQTLSAAIDLKRKLIEDLRPTLIDNVGLFAALRWHAQAIAQASKNPCAISVPLDERRFLPNIPIALFRIVQEALTVVTARGAGLAEFAVVISAAALSIRVAGTPFPGTGDPSSEASQPPELPGALHAVDAIRYRTDTLGGAFSYSNTPLQGAKITVTFPMDELLAA